MWVIAGFIKLCSELKHETIDTVSNSKSNGKVSEKAWVAKTFRLHTFTKSAIWYFMTINGQDLGLIFIHKTENSTTQCYVAATVEYCLRGRVPYIDLQTMGLLNLI